MAAVMKKEPDGEHPASHYLIVGDPEKVTTWHLRIKDADGKLDHGLMGSCKAALTVGFRGQKYDGPDKAAALSKLKDLYKSEGMKWDGEALHELSMVIDLSRVTLTEADGLTHTPIAVIGSWVKGGDSFSITFKDFQSIWQNFNKLGTDGRNRDDVVVDYNHATVDPDLSQGGEAPAAGWLKAITEPQPGDTFLFGDIAFTDRARQAIAANEYKYLSPVIQFLWADKRTGQNQGTTITSVALTNIPFLDELPAICLTDRGYVPAPAPAEPTPAAATTAALKETKTMKKVSVAPIKSGDKAGHLRISHADLPTGDDAFYANKDDVAEALNDAEAMDEKAGEKLSEATGLRGKRLSEQLPAIKERFGTKVITLSELPTKADGPDKGAPDFAKFAPAPGQLFTAEIFLAQQSEQILDEAIKVKKILPKERQYLRKLVLSDLREYLASRGAGAALDTREHGHAGEPDGSNAIEEFDGAIRAVLAEKRPGVKTYGDAMRIVASEKPELRRAYDEAQGTRKRRN